MMEREKMESIWEANMKIAEDYWQMWRNFAGDMGFWQGKSEEILKNYMQSSRQVFDEQMKWFDTVILQASKGQQQMHLIMKEAMITGMENMIKIFSVPWLEWNKEYQE